VLNEYKKEKTKIEKFADQWCKDNNYPITKNKYKTKNMARVYNKTWVKK
jgi:hypothetical protein